MQTDSAKQSKKMKKPLISVVIVNYNVKDYLAQSLHSIKRALRKIPYEIIVVDNASVDGSVRLLRKQFSEIEVIENEQNLGFGRANNQALRKVRGEFVVLINPDTVVQEDTFTKLLEFFQQNREASAATCKIINPDGAFSVDCRHSIPTPSIAFWKVTGMSRLFPKSKIFGKYNLTYLDPNTTNQVPAISGSFMMIKKKVLDSVGFFDERFFMYCEDIDLCHRINVAGYKIYYVPATQIIHYKGESTKKDNLDYVITFNRSLHQFFRKYYAPSSIFVFRWLVTLGIFLRGIFIYIKNFLRMHFPLVIDMIILNATVLFSFIMRMNLSKGFYWYDYFERYWIINLIASILFLFISIYFEVYPSHRFSIQSIIKTNIITFIFLTFLTFFLRQFAFSRMIVLISFSIGPLAMILWRTFLRRYYRGEKSPLGKDLFSKPTVVVGLEKDVGAVYQKLQSRYDIDYELVGWVSINGSNAMPAMENIRHLGSLEKLQQIIRIFRIRQVIFSTESLSYEQILKTMSNIDSTVVEYKMVPSNLDVIIGKSHIERLDDYPLLDIDYSIGKRFNRISKRLLDTTLSLPLLVGFLPLILISLAFHFGALESFFIRGEQDQKIKSFHFTALSPKHPANLWLLFWSVFIGRFSLVGVPFNSNNNFSKTLPFWYKPGLTGLVQINREKIHHPDDAEKYHLFYLKNQSVLLDLEIILKAIFQQMLLRSSK